MGATTFDYTAISEKAKDALRGEVPNAMVSTEEGFGGRVHVKIVSDALNGMTEREKQAFIWKILERQLGPDAQAISFVLPYGEDELP